MRITSGHLKGRVLAVAPGIRPAQDKVRQAIFSSLGDFVPGSRALDLYAGSGAYGLEAWSRGAASVTWVEKDRRVFDVLMRNVAALAGDAPELHCIRADADEYLARAPGTFDLVMADPPYDRSVGSPLLEKTLRLLESKSIVRDQGVLVFELDARQSAIEFIGWRLLRDREYGKTRVLIYQRTP